MRSVLSLTVLPALLIACGPTRTTDLEQAGRSSFRTEATAADGARPDEVALHVHGYLAGGINASRILAVANTASLEMLDDAVGLDVRAASSIVEARSAGPLATLEELDALYYVGHSAFIDLFDYALANDVPLEAGCPVGVIRDRAGNVYGDLEQAVAAAGTNGHLTLCEGTHGAYNRGYYRTDSLSVQANGAASVRGYFNFADATYEIVGVRFEGVGSGANVFASSFDLSSAAFGDDTHLFVTESDGWFEDVHFDGADEVQVENGSYTFMDASFDAMAPRTQGYSPVYVSYAEVVFIDSQFRNNPNRALYVASGSDVLFYDAVFGQGANANPDGDVVIDGLVLSGLGYLDGYRCVSGGGCSLD